MLNTRNWTHILQYVDLENPQAIEGRSCRRLMQLSSCAKSKAYQRKKTRKKKKKKKKDAEERKIKELQDKSRTKGWLVALSAGENMESRSYVG